MNPVKKVGIWIRVSTEDQARGESPEHHEERARMYAKAKGWEVVKTYHLEGVSGKTVMEHPESQKMLHDIKEGIISGLIFSKLARLARNTKELLEYSEIFRKEGADLISLHESIDTSSPAGRLFFTLIAAMAQWEREEIAERVAASVPVRAKLGKPLGGQAPFGYSWENKELVINSKEAPVRKLMFELFLKFKRKKTVANELNKQGYRTRKGAKFSGTTVVRLLSDPVAKGLRRANYTKSTGEGKHWVIKPSEEWVFIPAPAIVSVELWDKVNRILEEQKKTNQAPTRIPKYLFTGFIHCSCGKRMYVPSNLTKYRCNDCRIMIDIDDMETIFHAQLQGYLVSEEHIQEQLNQSERQIHEKEKLVQSLVAKEKILTHKMNTLMDLVYAGEIPKSGFNARYNPLHEQREQILKQIPQLEGEIDAIRNAMTSQDEIIHEAQDLFRNWVGFGLEHKRSIIELILDRIIIHQEEVEINLNYLPQIHSAEGPHPFKSTTERSHNPMDSWNQST